MLAQVYQYFLAYACYFVFRVEKSGGNNFIFLRDILNLFWSVLAAVIDAMLDDDSGKLSSHIETYYNMRKIFYLVLSFISFNSFAQSRTDRLYDVIGLSDGDEIMDSLKIAIPLIVIGFLIAYAFMWSKKDVNKVDSASTNVGCLGVIIMFIGFFFLLPLWAWIEAIFVSAMNIGLLIIIVCIIVAFIYSAFSKKK